MEPNPIMERKQFEELMMYGSSPIDARLEDVKRLLSMDSARSIIRGRGLFDSFSNGRGVSTHNRVGPGRLKRRKYPKVARAKR